MAIGKSPWLRWTFRTPSGFIVVHPGILLAVIFLMAGSGRGLEEAVLVLLPVVPPVAALVLRQRAGWWMLGWAAVALATLGTLEPPADLSDAVFRSLMLLSVSSIGVVAVGSYREEVGRLQRALRDAATHDDLTGLANRRALDDRLALEHHRLTRQPEGTLSLILLDLDDFQAFNDTYGHQSADDCLKRIAETVLARVRRATDLLARYGGDELLAVLPTTSRGEAVALAECMRRDVEALGLAHTGSTAGVVTVSLGVAAIDAEAISSLDALLTRADMALADAKSAGRNRVTVAG